MEATPATATPSVAEIIAQEAMEMARAASEGLARRPMEVIDSRPRHVACAPAPRGLRVAVAVVTPYVALVKEVPHKPRVAVGTPLVKDRLPKGIAKRHLCAHPP